MNYRSRWQQRRRREAQRRTAFLTGAAILAVSVAVGLLLMRGERPVWSRDFHSPRAVRFREYKGALYCTFGSRQAQAISLQNGRDLWPKAYEATVAFSGIPAVAGDRVILVDDNGRVTALDRRTGEGVWQAGTGEAIRSDPLLHRGLVFAGCSRGIVYALTASDGLERWRVRVGGPVDGGFAAVGDRLFMGTTNGAVLGVLWKTGAPLPWRRRVVGFPALGGPVEAEGNVIVGTDGGRALVIRPATGRVAARMDMPEAGLIRADPLPGDGCVYLGSTDGWVVACKLQDRQGGALAPLWQRRVGPELSAGPVMDRDYLYCGNGTRRLLALDRRTGRVVRRWEYPGVVRGSVAVAGGLIAAATADGAVMAFNAPPRPSPTR